MKPRNQKTIDGVKATLAAHGKAQKAAAQKNAQLALGTQVHTATNMGAATAPAKPRRVEKAKREHAAALKQALKSTGWTVTRSKKTTSDWSIIDRMSATAKITGLDNLPPRKKANWRDGLRMQIDPRHAVILPRYLWLQHAKAALRQRVGTSRMAPLTPQRLMVTMERLSDLTSLSFLWRPGEGFASWQTVGVATKAAAVAGGLVEMWTERDQHAANRQTTAWLRNLIGDWRDEACAYTSPRAELWQFALGGHAWPAALAKTTQPLVRFDDYGVWASEDKSVYILGATDAKTGTLGAFSLYWRKADVERYMTAARDRIWGSDRALTTEGGLRPFLTPDVVLPPWAVAIRTRIEAFRAGGVARSYCINGEPGTGKTTCAAAIGAQIGRVLSFDAEVIDADESVTITVGALDSFGATKDPDAEEDEEPQNGDSTRGGYTVSVTARQCMEMLKPDVLVLNDIDRLYDDAGLIHLLDMAKKSCEVTLITSNWANRFSDAVGRIGRIDDVIQSLGAVEADVRRAMNETVDALTPEQLKACEGWPLVYLYDLAERIRRLGAAEATAEFETVLMRRNKAHKQWLAKQAEEEDEEDDE
jgi:hypothetical protein